MIQNGYFENKVQKDHFSYEYKNNTLNFINKIINDIYSSNTQKTYEKLIIVFHNFNKTKQINNKLEHYFYNILEKIVNQEQLDILKKIYDDLENKKKK